MVIAGVGGFMSVVLFCAVSSRHPRILHPPACCAACRILTPTPRAPLPSRPSPLLQFASRLFKCLVSFLLDIEDDLAHRVVARSYSRVGRNARKATSA